MYRLAVLGVLAFLINTSTYADNVPVTEPTDIVKAWIPIGFDSNDRTQVLIDGILPSTCFRVGPYTTHVDTVSKTISIQQNMDGFLGLCCHSVDSHGSWNRN